MTLIFPDSFFFGTSTSACQIETAFDHDWKGVVAKDSRVFDRTTDHERLWREDVEIISSLAPNYRMSLSWSRLQRYPYAQLDEETVKMYHELLNALRAKGVNIMMVLFHWCSPLWFSRRGGWEDREKMSMFVDFAKKVVDEFGCHVTFWNTFNEPNLYSVFAYGLGEFPPYQKDVFKSVSVIKNMAEAHERVTNYIKQKYPRNLCGLSQNCVVFDADNIAGTIPSKMADYWYMEYLPGLFASCDYLGLSYYARLCFDPFPVSYLRSPEKFATTGREHDDIWEYFPQGLADVVKRYWLKHKMPIIITENGICTADDTKRVKAIKDYMQVLHSLIQDNVSILGYYHWSTWDNFEWTLGPSYKFGLYSCDPDTMKRTKRPSADLYSTLAHQKQITL